MNDEAATTAAVAAEPGFALFDTAIGTCALAWGPRGLIGVQLPEENGEAATRARMRRRFPDLTEAVPPESSSGPILLVRVRSAAFGDMSASFEIHDAA